jgi:hypothetical protein
VHAVEGENQIASKELMKELNSSKTRAVTRYGEMKIFRLLEW